MHKTIDIIGAGPCGTLLSVLLAKRDFSVTLHERNQDPRGAKALAGRSINLALAARGIHALRTAGIYSEVEQLLVPMRGRMVHGIDGTTELLSYGLRDAEQIYSASRGELNKILLDAAESTGHVKCRFQQAATEYDAAERQVSMHDARSDREYILNTQPVIAADGAGSVIRNSLRDSHAIDATETLLSHGYKELSIPAGVGGTFQLDPNALHIWPRGGFMLIALPNPGGDFTLTLFLANEGDISFESLSDESAATSFLETYFSDVAPLISNPAGSILNNPLGLLGTVRCSSWHDNGNVLLIGDAAHAIVPFHGQGMNLALEDCVVLERALQSAGSDWQTVFSQFENEQLANANAIADMALENYVEMRDTVRDPKFALRKQLSFELERRLPDRFIPRYSMVMFHADIPYRVAQERGDTQNELLEEFTRDANDLSDIDLEAALTTVVERLAPIRSMRIVSSSAP